MLISVIIPAYNTEKYISDMLECVIGQTYRDIEIIIVDDGSDDGTANVIRSYASKDSRIIPVFSERGGVSCARNKGIEMARGQKIFFWDSDDTIELDTIEKCIKFGIDNQVNAVLYGYADNINKVKQAPHASSLRAVYRDKEIIYDLIPCFLGHSYKDINAWIKGKVGMREGKEATALWRIMLDAETVKRHHLRFDTNLTLGEDTKFMNEYLLREVSVGYLNECLYYLTVRSDGANLSSQKEPVHMMNDKIKVISAREEIDHQAISLYQIDTHPYWSGTVVLSAVQLAIRFAKNNSNTFKQNLADCSIYMRLPETKKSMQDFKPSIGVKALPFIIAKMNWKLLFMIVKIIPNTVVARIM